MISVAEAWSQIRQHCVPLSPSRIPIVQALGLVLAEEIRASLDSPPYDKSLVDGYAVRTADCQISGTELRALEEVMAGQVPSQPLQSGGAIRIMTGATLPAETDAVVMVERTEPAGSDSAPQVRLLEVPRVGQNLMRRGESMRCGQVVLTAGHRLRGIEAGLLAELGVTAVSAIRRPQVAILSTGNELVPSDQTPGPGQIRNSNSPLLAGLVAEAGGEPFLAGIARDTTADLARGIEAGLTRDVLVLSGGVSAGVLDLVPTALRAQGVEPVFHQIRLKPGKPLWFGKRTSAGRTQLVFGLPGNPVSSLVCFHLFVRPALALLAGRAEPVGELFWATLESNFQHRGDRPTYYPAKISPRVDRGSDTLPPHEPHWKVQPLGWRGSADLCTLTQANALICFEPGDQDLVPGSCVRVLPL